MRASCVHDVGGRVRRSITGGGRPCPFQRPGSEADHVLRRIGSGRPMTVAQLRRAAEVLGRHVGSGRMDVLVARVRVAVRLERLGA